MKRFFPGNKIVNSQILILALFVIAFGQNRTIVKGVVTDQRGAVVAKAEVEMRARSGVRLVAQTDANGAYTFENVPPGDYIVDVNAKGFAGYVSATLHVGRGQTVTNDARLSIAGVSESVVVTASGTTQRVDETSKAISSLDERSIEAKRELTLPEALRGVPGVRVQQQGSFGALTSIRLRGLRSSDTAILLDGLRVRDASDISGSAVPIIPDLLPADLDRIEILRGSGSSIYGTNAIGGVINLDPQTGAGASHFEFGFDGGSRALFRERFKGAGGLGKRSGYSFGLTRIDVRHGVDGNDQYGNTAGSGRWQFNPTPSVMISSNFYGTIANLRTNDDPIPLASAFTGGQYPKAIPGVTFRPDLNNPDAGRRNRMLVWSVKLSQQVSEKVSYTIGYQHVGTRRRNYDGPVHGPKDTSQFPFGDFVFIAVNNGGTDTLDARANFRLGRRNLATAGFEFENESLFQFSEPLFARQTNTTDRQRTFALFGQDQIYLLDDRFQISLGVRAQTFSVRAADRPGFLSVIKPEKSLTGDGSIAYFIRSSGTKLRAHVGNGFRAPSLFERFGEGAFSPGVFTRFGDPTLRAEQSISVDGGFDQKLAGDRARLGATYFYTRLQRVIVFAFPFHDPLNLQRFLAYRNQPGGMARGLESYLEAAPWRKGTLNVSYTYTNSDRFLTSLGLQPEYVIPKHLFGMTFTQRYRSFLLSFDLNRTGSYIAPVFEIVFPFRTAELRFPGYTKADMFGSYERHLSEKVTMMLFAGADNLFAVKYYENGYHAPGFVARGGMTFRFR
jgi:vitamin B12 transporter